MRTHLQYYVAGTSRWYSRSSIENVVFVRLTYFGHLTVHNPQETSQNQTTFVWLTRTYWYNLRANSGPYFSCARAMFCVGC